MNKKKETHLKVADSLDKPRSNSVFKRRAKDTAKIVGATIVGLMLLGNTSKTYGQPKVKQGTELSGKQDKLAWGELKAKFKPEEKKAVEKTWIEKGEKKYDVEYKDGVITFKNFDGRGQDGVYSLISDSALLPYAKTPLRVIMYAERKGFGAGVYLVYDEGMIFIMPVRDSNGEAHVRYSLLVKPDSRQANLGG